MAGARLRRVGGSTMLAIPPEILESMSVAAGSSLDLSVADGVLTVRPTKPHYSLQQLLAEEQAAGIDALADFDRDWVDAPPVGRETW